MSQQDELLMVRAMMRRLWQLYDLGGQSGRTVRAQLLEAAFWPQPLDLPEVEISYEAIEKITAGINHDEPVRFGLVQLEKLDTETYFCFVIHAMIATKDGIEPSFTEQNILSCCLLLLHDERRMELFFRAFGGEVFATEQLIAEGRRRQELRHESD